MTRPRAQINILMDERQQILAENKRLRDERTMEWTQKQPTETECWYWTKRPEDVIGIVRYVEAGPNDGDLLVRDLGPCHAADTGNGCNERHSYWQDEIEWWAGPILEPKSVIHCLIDES